MLATHSARRSLVEAAHLAGHIWAQRYEVGAQPYASYKKIRGAMRISAIRHPRLERACWDAWLEGASEVRSLSVFPLGLAVSP